MSKKKILIADDEPSMRLLVSSTLDDGSFELSEAVDGNDAIHKAAQCRPDLIILDVMMPILSGIEVCRQVKTMPSLRQAKIMILTAKGQANDLDEAMEAGADYFLKKPFSPLDLRHLVDQILELDAVT
jgi:CheY-like chemotaxis protein